MATIGMECDKKSIISRTNTDCYQAKNLAKTLYDLWSAQTELKALPKSLSDSIK